MIKLHHIYLHYNKFSEQYSMEVAVGDDLREIKFKMNDNQAREAIAPILNAICDACAMSAAELKKDIIAAVENTKVVE